MRLLPGKKGERCWRLKSLQFDKFQNENLDWMIAMDGDSSTVGFFKLFYFPTGLVYYYVAVAGRRQGVFQCNCCAWASETNWSLGSFSLAGFDSVSPVPHLNVRGIRQVPTRNLLVYYYYFFFHFFRPVAGVRSASGRERNVSSSSLVRFLLSFVRSVRLGSSSRLRPAPDCFLFFLVHRSALFQLNASLSVGG